MFRATDLARYIIAYENQLSRQIDITNLRLQKTLYYIQGYYFKHYNRCAFEEKIYNWAYGPVVPEVYYIYNSNTYRTIIIPYETRNEIIEGFANHSERGFINKIINKCNVFTSAQLVDKTHKEDPWKNTQKNEIISNESIDEFFYKNDPLQLYS